jgi:alanine dehydrogenase
LAAALCDIGLTAIAFETVAEGGRLPILVPMSDIAGRIAVQVGTHLLHTPQGGKGVLLGGLASVPRAMSSLSVPAVRAARRCVPQRRSVPM